jgi:hypothetical protein
VVILDLKFLKNDALQKIVPNSLLLMYSQENEAFLFKKSNLFSVWDSQRIFKIVVEVKTVMVYNTSSK